MDNNSKFYADIQRILKYDRANNNGNFNPERACKKAEYIPFLRFKNREVSA
jgi:hypothetical protein